MPTSFYDAFSQGSDSDQYPSQEVVRAFAAKTTGQKRKANWPVLEPVIEEARGDGNKENEEPSVDEEEEEELETATVVNETIRGTVPIEL